MTEQAETTKSSVPNIIEFHSSALLPNKQKQILPYYMYDRDIKNREREERGERKKKERKDTMSNSKENYQNSD